MIAPLPPTLTYATEAELVELETLRTRVSLLRQEIYLEQVRGDGADGQDRTTIHTQNGFNCALCCEFWWITSRGVLTVSSSV